MTKVNGRKALSFVTARLTPRFCGDPVQATDHFRNLDVLLHFLGSCVYGSRGAFAVVSANQRLSIDGGKHISWIFFLLI